MTRSRGQTTALNQLEAIAAVSRGGVSLGTPTAGPRLSIDVSIDCSSIEQAPTGVHLRGRERFSITIPTDFPYRQPSVWATHRRWAGTPHVHWGTLLCLYQATIEWDAQAGMYGLLRRLDLWLQRAAVGELDPDDAPLHPPVQYTRSDTLIVIDDDAPEIDGAPWIGFGVLDLRGGRRIDLTGWTETWPSGPAALAILLPQPFTWEYPETVEGLFAAVADQNVTQGTLDALLVLAAHTREPATPMHVVIGTPMRRGHDGRERQHLAVWEIAADMADDLRKAAPKPSDSVELAELRTPFRDAVLAWARASPTLWCTVSDNRPEVTIRRDDRSPVADAFGGQAVSIWGCGAIGSAAAEWIARAGARRIVLHDTDIVTLGVLVRQNFVEDDVGKAKSLVLAARLKAIRPDLDVDPRVGDVITGPLSNAAWHDHADVVIDATASSTVRLKLQDASRNDLHEDQQAGKLAGFVMPYLGQLDHRLPWAPPDFVRRDEVADYPTNFRAMKAADIERLTARGELLTRLLIERWCPDL